MKNIVIYMQDFEGGGAEKMMTHLANEFFKNSEVQLKVVVVRKVGSYLSLIDPGIPIIELKSDSVFGSIPQLSRFFRKERPDLVYCTLRHVNIAAILAKIVARVKSKVLVREACHLIYPNGQKLSMKIAYHILPFIYPFADKVIAVSNGVKESLNKKLLIKKNVVVLNNPVITESVLEKFEENVDEALFDGSKKVILSIGRLNKQKDYVMLINAFHKVIRRTSDTCLCILGEGPERDTLSDLVDQLGLAGDVHFLGFKPNPYKYLKKSDLFVLSSRYEGSPNVLVEALASGVPVVSTDCPSGPFEILKGGEIGPLVPMGDVDAMAEAIVVQLQKADRGTKGVERSRDYMAKKVSKDYLNALKV